MQPVRQSQSWSNRQWWSAHQDAWKWDNDDDWWQQGGHGHGELVEATKDKDVDMPETEPQTPLQTDEEVNEATRVDLEKRTFWESEEASRLANGLPLPFEVHQLKTHAWQGGTCDTDVKKVLACFGFAKGAGSASKRLLQELQKENGFYTPGERVSISSPAFTLCKQLMAAGFKQWNWNMVFARQTDRAEPIKCYCFPATSLMIQGCRCNKVYLLSKDLFYGRTFCEKCSLCMRCGKYLACNPPPFTQTSKLGISEVQWIISSFLHHKNQALHHKNQAHSATEVECPLCLFGLIPLGLEKDIASLSVATGFILPVPFGIYIVRMGHN